MEDFRHDSVSLAVGHGVLQPSGTVPNARAQCKLQDPGAVRPHWRRGCRGPLLPLERQSALHRRAPTFSRARPSARAARGALDARYRLSGPMTPTLTWNRVIWLM